MSTPEAPAPQRRTITITGQATPPRRRPPRPLHERAGSNPDRVALWAFLLGIALILVAAISAHV
jgi:hypothetical protein